MTARPSLESLLAIERAMAVSARWPDEFRRALEEEDTPALQVLFNRYAEERESKQ